MWQLWRPGDVLRNLEIEHPLLACWNSKMDPEQQRLQKYLDGICTDLNLNLADIDAPVSILMEIDVEKKASLLHLHDLENYLTPVAFKVRAHIGEVVHAAAIKRVGGGSRIQLARALSGTEDLREWISHRHSPGGSYTSHAWKESVRSSLAQVFATPIPSGPVAVKLAWRCGPHRNWVNLWKPTGDAMGPILGCSSPNPFNPDDDRIVELELHLQKDPTMGQAIDVGMWWRKA